jgi:hypothetical protein
MMLATPPAALVSFLEPWSTFYGDSLLTQTVVTFAHVGGLLVGGGIAIATDRVTLRTSSDVDRRRHLIEMSHIHRAVVTALAVVVLSGIALVTADIEAIWGSWIYWAKMFLVILLLANGARMRKIESGASREPVVSAAQWSALRGSAVASLILWLATAFAGVALINYA